MKKLSRRITYLAISLALPMSAHATDGYFSHGYGLKAKGMGGANNPVSMAWVGHSSANQRRRVCQWPGLWLAGCRRGQARRGLQNG